MEDVRVGKAWVRRLVFQQNRGLVQSECALTSPAAAAKSQAVARLPDHSALQSEYHAAIIASFAFLVRAPFVSISFPFMEVPPNAPHQR